MSVPMSDEECRVAMSSIQDSIDEYAKLIVKSGVNIQEGQELVMSCPIEAADFGKRVVKAAYEAGAGHVTVNWNDDELSRLTYEYTPLEWFKTTPSWKVEQMNSLAEAGAAFLFLDGSDPAALKGIDPKKPAARGLAYSTQCDVYRKKLDFGHNAWCIAGVPVVAWAREVFPGASDNEAMYKLWKAILYVARSNGEDPQAAWETHNAAFKKNLRFLNERKFDKLHYTSENGTDLYVGLPEGHIWEGGAATTTSDVRYFPNMPTEEVFTSPDRMRVDGIVYSALPLAHAGNVVKNFWFKFEEGAVVDYGAEEGRDTLTQILETDDNAVRLGECALISKNTPIRETGLLFYDTLYDENASCHLALGTGFPECLEGGLDMEKEELIEAGLNQSHTHVDFMIGSDDLTIMGIGRDGEETRVFVNGQWAWE